MLKRLYAKNYALLKDITVEFGKGLNIITGETGAGKSIIVGALSAILGDKVDTTIVNGKILMSNKQLLTLDEEQVKSNARAHIVDLLERADTDISPKWPIL